MTDFVSVYGSFLLFDQSARFGSHASELWPDDTSDFQLRPENFIDLGHAFFLLMFGRLEAEINDEWAQLIERGKNLEDRQLARYFDDDIQRPDQPGRTSFVTRAKLVIPEEFEGENPLRKAISLYETRNRLAHGVVDVEPLDLETIAFDFALVSEAIASINPAAAPPS